MAKTKRTTRKTSRNAATVSAQLTYHTTERLPLHRLPFVGRRSDDTGISFWNVPRTGGYGGGCATGYSLAMAYLRFWKTNRQDYGGLLQHVVLDMCDAYKQGLTKEEEDALRGQIVGFFSGVCNMVRNVAPLFRNPCDAAEAAWILEQANAGLAGADSLAGLERTVSHG